MGDTQEKSKLDDAIEKYLERYENILDDNDDTLTRATERSIQSITSAAPTIVEQIVGQIHFISRSHAEVPGKGIQPSESEGLDSSGRTLYYCRVQIKPTKEGIFRYMSPLVRQIWITACSHGKDQEERSLEELMKAMEDEAKLRQPKHTSRMLLLQTKRGSDKHSDFLE